MKPTIERDRLTLVVGLKSQVSSVTAEVVLNFYDDAAFLERGPEPKSDLDLLPFTFKDPRVAEDESNVFVIRPTHLEETTIARICNDGRDFVQ